MISLKRVKRYCKDYTKIENFDRAIADTTQSWECHHRMELMKTGAVVDSSKQDLIDWGIYYNRPADELIFLMSNEHRALHMKGKQYSKGKCLSEEHKAKIAAALKGRKRGPYKRKINN